MSRGIGVVTFRDLCTCVVRGRGDCDIHRTSAPPTMGTVKPIAAPTGWRCPGCSTVWAPSVPKCDRCGPRSDFLDRVDPPESK